MFLPLGLWGLIHTALNLLTLIIIADVIISYIPSLSRRNPIVMLLHKITRYMTAPFRKILPPQRMGNAYVEAILR